MASSSSRHHHHKGMHHALHPSAAASDASGWVESISALNDEHPATALLLGSTPPGASGASTGAGAAPGGSAGAAAAAALRGAAAEPAGAQQQPQSPEEEFESCLEHALMLATTEVRTGLERRTAQRMLPALCAVRSCRSLARLQLISRACLLCLHAGCGRG